MLNDETKGSKKIPLFSVITAAYRAKPFLHRYFQTLSNQTICDFEVILSIRFDSSEEKISTSKIIHKESENLKRYHVRKSFKIKKEFYGENNILLKADYLNIANCLKIENKIEDSL